MAPHNLSVCGRTAHMLSQVNSTESLKLQQRFYGVCRSILGELHAAAFWSKAGGDHLPSGRHARKEGYTTILFF
jgi:hypothetical protein